MTFYLVTCQPHRLAHTQLRIPVWAETQTRAAIVGRIVGELTAVRIAALYEQEQ